MNDLQRAALASLRTAGASAGLLAAAEMEFAASPATIPPSAIPATIPGFARVVTMRAQFPPKGSLTRLHTGEKIPGGFRPTDALIVAITMPPAGYSIIQLGWVYDSGMGSWRYNLSTVPGEMSEGPGTLRGQYGRKAAGIGPQMSVVLSTSGDVSNGQYAVVPGATYYLNVSYREQTAPQNEGFVSLKVAG